MKQAIRNFSGQIRGYLEDYPNGDVKATDFYGRIVGWYRADRNVTTDFYGRVVAQGNCASGLIPINP